MRKERDDETNIKTEKMNEKEGNMTEEEKSEKRRRGERR